MSHPAEPRRRARRGFTLIELLAVILIIGLLAAALTPMIGKVIESARVNSCKQNLRNVYQAFVIYHNKYHTLPDRSGAQFFAQLYSRKAMQQTKQDAERLTCPGIDHVALAIGQLEWDKWWSDLDLVDGSYSSYAGRDMKQFPMRKFPADGKEPLMGDDNDPEMNHDTGTNVLFDNDYVETYEIELLREQGVVGPEEEVLVVGPSSQLEVLRKLSLR